MDDNKPLEGEELLDAVAKKIGIEKNKVDDLLVVAIPFLEASLKFHKLVESTGAKVRCESNKTRDRVNALMCTLDIWSDQFENLMGKSDIYSVIDVTNPGILNAIDTSSPITESVIKLMNWFQKEPVDLTCTNSQDVRKLQESIIELKDVHVKNFLEFSSKVHEEKQNEPPKEITAEEFQDMVDKSQEGGEHDRQKGVIKIPKASQGCGSQG